MDIQTETGTCPLCGSDDPRPSRYADGPFRVVRCAGCRLWYLSPRPTPDAMAALYRGDNYFVGGDAGYTDYRKQEASLRLTFRRLLRRMAALGATGGRLLEVGSGLGYFLEEAASQFDHCAGIELSPVAAASAAKLSGAPVYNSVEALPPDARFDCIVALHVIEHIYDPVPFLRRLATHLAPDGSLVLAAPDMGSFWRHAMGGSWPSFKYPEHISFYDSRTLKRLLAETGFAEARRLPYLHDFPLSEILAKLGLRAPRLAWRLRLPLPATTVCYAARRAGREAT